MNSREIVSKLWSLCDILRDDGITYHQYVTELTYLLFLKMASETGVESELPNGYRWSDIRGVQGVEQLIFYKELLIHLGALGSAQVQAIFQNAQTSLRQPRILKALVDTIEGLDWYSAREEGLGNMYEGLLERNATEKKSGAGQYFTPRPLIDSMVALMRPQAGEYVQDPAAGTGGFLIAADRWIKAQTNNLWDLTEAEQYFQRHTAFCGMELVPDAHRLGLMNLMLHDVTGDLQMGDALSEQGARLPKAHVVLTNPPFGTKKGGGLPSRDDFTYPTSNKQLAFLQHIHRGLRPGGRAAVVLPDNVLFEDNTGRDIRRDLMEKCDLHTILRLPTGIFYSQGVKTNVLFFTRGQTDKNNTRDVWVYDLRSNMPQFGKTRPLTRETFTAFEAAFGPDPLGKAPRNEDLGPGGEHGRFRRFTRDQIAARNDNLDLTWLRDDSADDVLPEPDILATEIIDTLRTALEEMEALADLLGPDEDLSNTVAEAAE